MKCSKCGKKVSVDKKTTECKCSKCTFEDAEAYLRSIHGVNTKTDKAPDTPTALPEAPQTLFGV